MILYTLNSEDGAAMYGIRQHFTDDKMSGRSLCGLDLNPTHHPVKLEEQQDRWMSCKKCIKIAQKKNKNA